VFFYLSFRRQEESEKKAETTVEKNIYCPAAKTSLLLMNRRFYVYILTNQLRTVLYTGVTNDICRRITEHYAGRGQDHSFTSRYNVYYLIYYEIHQYVNNAIAREKEIKGWRREKKMQLIYQFNPTLKFMNETLLGQWPPREITGRL
jgi:putative endonuclease